MSIDIAQPRSRRALLTGAVAGLGALAATALGRPAPVRAGDPSVTLGGDNSAGSPTIVRNDTTDSRAIIGVAGTGIGMHGPVARLACSARPRPDRDLGRQPDRLRRPRLGKTGGLFTGGRAATRSTSTARRVHPERKAGDRRGEHHVRSGRVDLNPSSLVLVTLQGRQKGIWVEGVVPDYTGGRSRSS